MTGFKSKKAASLDEEGFYTIHPKDEDDDIQVYQRTWVGLTDEEVHDIVWSLPYEPSQEHIRAIEAKLKEKNNGLL